MFARRHAAEPLGLGNLTEHSDERLGRPHGHGEDGAGVLALVRQGHVADADAELMRSGSNQLDPIITKGWGTLGEWEAGLLLALFTVIFQSQASVFGRRALAWFGAGETPPEFEPSLCPHIPEPLGRHSRLRDAQKSRPESHGGAL